MTSINIPKDDIAVRETRNRNTSTPAVQPLQQASPNKPVDPAISHQTGQSSHTTIRQRARKDRRQGERRKQQIDILLDTRSHSERRKNVRRSSDNETNQQTPPLIRGIDEYT